MIRNIKARLRAFGRAESGVASVEFAITFPVILFLFFWAIELGVLMTKTVLLEHALDVTMRDLRLGRIPNPTSAKLKEEICDQLGLIKNCQANMTLELQPVSKTTWAMPHNSVTCVDRDEAIQPSVTFDMGKENEVMLVRACIIVDPLLPGTGPFATLQRDHTGGFTMSALSAFVNEPS
jgi:Flp pilus assembly protein TadG